MVDGAIDLQRGIYNVQLERWIRHFPLGESLIVISKERFQRETRQVMKEILEFLDAPDPQYFDDKSVSMAPETNGSLSRLISVGQYKQMPNATRKFLERFYKPYNAQLSNLLGESWRGVWDPV